jgi:RNA polymerase sigma-70 factor (ECF subfamily)
MEDFAERKEEILLLKLQGSNKQAFETIYSLHWKYLYAFACRISKSNDDAEELVQDVFVDIWFKRTQINVKQSLRNYLLATLKYKYLDKIRREKRYDEFTDYIIQSGTFVSNVNPENEYIIKEGREFLMNKMQNLPEKCKEIFFLRKIENYSVSEIAGKLMISKQTVKNQLTKAYKIMRPHYEEVITTSVLLLFTI